MTDITVAIPSYNCSLYIRYVLDKLTHQKTPNLPVLIMDNGSTDGTIGLLSELMGRNFYQKKSQEKNALWLHFFQGIHEHSAHPWVNAFRTRRKLAELCRTEFIFFLDPDVALLPLTLPRLKRELIKNPKAAYIGIKYEPDTQDHNDELKHKHIMLGATLWRTKDFLALPPIYNENIGPYVEGIRGCDCNFAYWQTLKRKKIALHSKIEAEHLKNVFES